MTTTTTRFGILRPVTTDPAAGAPTTGLTKYLTSPTDRLEAVGTVYGQGTLAARSSAAVAGRIYYATDAQALFYDTGSAWILLAAAPRTAAVSGIKTLKTSWDTLAIGVMAIPTAGTYRITMSADFNGPNPGTGAIDVQVHSGASVYRVAAAGDQLQVYMAGAPGTYGSGSKQVDVTTPNGANVDVYGHGSIANATAKAINITCVPLIL